MKTKILSLLAVLVIIAGLCSCGEKTEEYEYTAQLNVECTSILDDMSVLKEEKRTLVPEDGIIFSSEVGFNEGESVFDVISRNLKDSKIQFEYKSTPGTGSVYIEGINNIYEFDAGEMSGWLFEVNGEMPLDSISDCKLNSGDNVRVYYCTDYLSIEW